LVSHMRVVINHILTIQSVNQITDDFTRSLHSSLDFANLKPEEHGVYRTVNVTIADRHSSPGFAKHEDVPNLMKEMFANFRNMVASGEHHPFYLCSFLHFTFLQIDPFRDGNGRVGRLLMNAVLIAYEYPFCCIQPNIKDIYFRSLTSARRLERDFTQNRVLPEDIDSPYDLLIRITAESVLRSYDIGIHMCTTDREINNETV